MENKEKDGDKDQDDKKVKVTLIWGGTGASKPDHFARTDTAGEVFNAVYDRFKQTPTDQDTFELNDQSYAKTEFGVTVEKLLEKFGEKLSFEVIPPTSGA